MDKSVPTGFYRGQISTWGGDNDVRGRGLYGIGDGIQSRDRQSLRTRSHGKISYGSVSVGRKILFGRLEQVLIMRQFLSCLDEEGNNHEATC